MQEALNLDRFLPWFGPTIKGVVCFCCSYVDVYVVIAVEIG
jgi:hypothetical protein